MLLKLKSVGAVVALVLFAACSEEPPIIAQTDDIDAFATQVLNSIQDESFDGNREYCGYIFELADGGLAATAPIRGSLDACDLPPVDDTTLASYHTHGAYSDEYDSEVPSPDDLYTDFADGIDGYVGTPGGRVWLVDFETETAIQLCGQGCILSDPDFDAAEAGPIPTRLTLDQVEARFAE